MTRVEISQQQSIISTSPTAAKTDCDKPAMALSKVKQVRSIPSFKYAGQATLSSQPRNFSTPALISSGKIEKTAPTDSASVSPVSFLQSLLERKRLHEKNNEKDSSSSSLHSTFFSKPGKEDMDAYDTDIVTAVRSRDIETLKRLHKEGRSLNACNKFGESLLHMACRRGYADVVTYLMKEGGARANVKDDYGRTPLHDACWTPEPNYDVMIVLLDSVDLRMLLAEDVRGHTPFHYSRREHWGSWIDFLKQNLEVPKMQ